MPVLTSAQAGANVDPVLTAHFMDYKPQEFGWTALAPIVPTELLSGTTIKFDTSDFVNYDTASAPLADSNIRDFFYSDSRFDLKPHRLMGRISKSTLERIEAQGIPVELEARTVQGTLDSIRREAAADIAALATNASNYDSNHKVALSGTDKIGGSTSQLLTIAEDAIGIIDLSTDRMPNIAVVDFNVAKAAFNDPLFVDRVKYTKPPEGYGGYEAKAALLASLWGIDRVVIARMKTKGSDGTVSYNGAGCIVFAYVADTQNLYVPSAFYTYQSEAYPIAEPMTYRTENESYLYPVKTYYEVQQTGPSAAFLVTGAI